MWSRKVGEFCTCVEVGICGKYCGFCNATAYSIIVFF